MQIHVGSKHVVADTAVALDVSGREHLVIVAKATWTIPEPGERPRPLPPEAIVRADEFYGAPGESPLRRSVDTDRFKARCDVLFDSTAYAQDNHPSAVLEAGWQIGPASKMVRVVGPRVWTDVLEPSVPQAFVRMPLSYCHAYGGARWFDLDGQAMVEAFLSNPVGQGFAGPRTIRQMVGQPVPCLEAPDDPVRRPDGNHRAQALGPLSRHWTPRKDYAGTYDEYWKREVFPFLPDDFDEAFHQVAPVDQQIPYPTGGERVALTRLLPHGPGAHQRRFALPRLDQWGVRVLRTDYSQEYLQPVVDTLFFETDAVTDETTGRQGRFSAVWRVSTPLRRRIQEFDIITVGPVNEAWWAAKAGGRFDAGCVGCGSPSAPALVVDREFHE